MENPRIREKKNLVTVYVKIQTSAFGLLNALKTPFYFVAQSKSLFFIFSCFLIILIPQNILK